MIDSYVRMFYFICRPMLVHHMILLSFGLLRKNLGNLREFWANGLPPPPGKKLPVRLCLMVANSTI